MEIIFLLVVGFTLCLSILSAAEIISKAIKEASKTKTEDSPTIIQLEARDLSQATRILADVLERRLRKNV